MQNRPAESLLLVADGDHRITRVNSALEAVTGYMEDEVLGRIWHELLLGEDQRREVLADLERAANVPAPVPLRRRDLWCARDGSFRLVEWGQGLLVDEAGRITQIVITATHIDEANAAARRGTFRWVIADNRFCSSEALHSVLGIQTEALDGTFAAFLECVHPGDRATVRETMTRAVTERTTFHVQMRIVRPGGEVRHLATSGEVISSRRGTPLRVTGRCHDVTETRLADDARRAYEKATREALFLASTHDDVTGLPNRTLLLDRLEQAIARSRRTPDPFAVLLVDVDRFKLVNQSLGHAAGDEALRALAQRLRAVVRPADTVARVGTDEYAIVTDGRADAGEARMLADRILAAVSAPIEIAGRELIFTASVGVALAGSDEDTPSSLLRDAAAAVDRAQEQGGNRCELYRRGMTARALAWLEVEQGLRRALADGGLRVVYQPIVRLSDDQPIALEALARLDVAGRGPVLPADFIPLAEQTGLIQEIGRHIITQACSDTTRFLAARPGAPLQVTVNLSATELSEPGLVGSVAAALADSGLEPARLCIEMTESSLIGTPAESAETLRWLRAAGLTLALDDFGTGYSSLAHLRYLPVDVLKIDRSFVAGLGTTREDDATVATIISLSHALGVKVVAEGVETPEQLAIVRALGADYAQGYLFSPPLDADQIPGVLETLATR